MTYNIGILYNPKPKLLLQAGVPITSSVANINMANTKKRCISLHSLFHEYKGSKNFDIYLKKPCKFNIGQLTRKYKISNIILEIRVLTYVNADCF